MKYCVKCNYKVNEDANYCTNCGQKLKWNTVIEHFDINNRVEKIKKLKYFDEELDKIIRYNEDFLINAENYYENNACPYCGAIFDRKVTQKKKCHECKKTIIKRTNMYNRKGLLIKLEDLIKFNNYDDKIREIKNEDREFDQMMITDNYYKDYFIKLKQKGDLSVRDITYSFYNYCACEFEKEALNLYNADCSWKNSIAFLNNIHFALANWRKMYQICIKNAKNEIALDILTMIMYKSIIGEYVYYEMIDYVEGFDRDMKSLNYPFGYSGYMVDFLEENNIKLEEFKNYFFKKNHSFLIFTKPKEFVWKYMELSLLYTINNYKKYGKNVNIL